MNTPIKVLTSLALAAAGAFPPAACGVSVGNALLETALAAVFEGLALYAGTAIGLGAGFAGSENGEIIAYVVISSYPLAASVGAFAAGEGADGLSENPGAAFGYTTLAAYTQFGAFLGGAALYDAATDDAGDEPYENAIYADAAFKPIVVTLTYNLVKKPLAPPRPECRLPSLEPYIAAATASDGAAVPVYGVTLSF
jgi:hypothetical protein